jgi:hypothetical protein
MVVFTSVRLVHDLLISGALAIQSGLDHRPASTVTPASSGAGVVQGRGLRGSWGRVGHTVGS